MKYPLPQPEEVSEKDRDYGFSAYIMMFAGTYFPLPFIEIISSFIYYVYYKKRSRYGAFHSYQSLMGQVPITIINTGYFIYIIKLLIDLFKYDTIEPYGWDTFFAILAVIVVINLAYIIYSLYVALKAKKGQIVYMPLVGKMAFEKFYGDDAIEIISPAGRSGQNSPPV